MGRSEAAFSRFSVAERRPIKALGTQVKAWSSVQDLRGAFEQGLEVCASVAKDPKMADQDGDYFEAGCLVQGAISPDRLKMKCNVASSPKCRFFCRLINGSIILTPPAQAADITGLLSYVRPFGIVPLPPFPSKVFAPLSLLRSPLRPFPPLRSSPFSSL